MDSASRSREPNSNVSLHPVTANLPVVPGKEPAAPAKVSRTTVWLHRVSLVIFVMFCIELGLLLAALPWTRVWTDNTLLAMHPALGAFLRDNFVRGVISGLGLIDVWIGIWEAVHYHDPGTPKN
jgi:hypothetical protein